MTANLDGDGLADGHEKAVVAIRPDTNMAGFKADLTPATSTDALLPDTDGLEEPIHERFRGARLGR